MLSLTHHAIKVESSFSLEPMVLNKLFIDEEQQDCDRFECLCPMFAILCFVKGLFQVFFIPDNKD